MCYQNHSFIRDLQLADMSFTGEANVDILIGEDLYCYRRDERSESCNIVAINSAFDWATKGDLDLTVCTFTAHVLKIGCNETETTNLNDKIHRFWDQIGISNKLQFQMYPNAIAAGVEKVYLQINVEKKKIATILDFYGLKFIYKSRDPDLQVSIYPCNFWSHMFPIFIKCNR